jgi:excisionase family DNA binding protein
MSQRTEPVLTVPEAADALRLHPSTVRRWLREGHLQGTRMGKAWRIPWRAVFREDGTLRSDLGPVYDY